MKPKWQVWANEAKAEFPKANSALLPLLHRIQTEEGYLSENTINDVAELLQLPVPYVESVVSFYSLYFQKPVGKRVIHVCVGLSCALNGSDQLMHHLEGKLGIQEGQTTQDGEVTLLEAECLAACDLAPVAQVNLRFVAPVESLEGKRGNPRLKPPFPAVAGLYGMPTVVNNVETICNLPPLVENGPEWYRTMGTEKSPGLKVMSVSGHVNRPGNYEIPLSTPLRSLIEDYAGGIKGGRQVKAIIPGGSSVPVLTADKLDTPVDYEAILAAGSMLGSGGCIVIDDQTCMVAVSARLVRFYREESCGKCTPCREGTFWMTDVLERMEAGAGNPRDLDLIRDMADNIAGKCFCPLGDASLGVVVSAMKYFEDEFEAHVTEHSCPMGARLYDTVNH